VKFNLFLARKRGKASGDKISNSKETIKMPLRMNFIQSEKLFRSLRGDDVGNIITTPLFITPIFTTSTMLFKVTNFFKKLN
jgi:hypothetical protein